MEMNKHKVDPDTQNPRKRMKKGERIIDKLHDDILIAIVSCMSLKDAVRTSVLSSRWRYLWMFSGKLEFDDRDTSTGKIMKRVNFKAWVNRVLKLHRGPQVDSLVIRFSTNLYYQARTSGIDSWIYFAMQKKVKSFELNLSVEKGIFPCFPYRFPNIKKLLSRSDQVKSFGFRSLRSLRLAYVDIEDEVVHYFLASCPCIEQLCIRASNKATKNLEIVDPLPNLKELEISDCCNLRSMIISATNLISCTYHGNNISPPFKTTPNLIELTLGGKFCQSFVYEPNKHSSYSNRLVKLVLNFQTVGRERTIASPDLHQLYSLKRLELTVLSMNCRSLLFFTSLIKSSPNLQEFRIKIEYLTYNQLLKRGSTQLFPVVSSVMTAEFQHKNLKVIELSGYVGITSEDEFILHLIKVAPSLDVVFIDTQTDHHAKENYDRFGTSPDWQDCQLRLYAMYRAEGLARTCISQIKFVIT
ncbi:hypothetical protein ABFS82_09G130700 [Erythranthe guttata]